MIDLNMLVIIILLAVNLCIAILILFIKRLKEDILKYLYMRINQLQFAIFLMAISSVIAIFLLALRSSN